MGLNRISRYSLFAGGAFVSGVLRCYAQHPFLLFTFYVFDFAVVRAFAQYPISIALCVSLCRLRACAHSAAWLCSALNLRVHVLVFFHIGEGMRSALSF